MLNDRDIVYVILLTVSV